MDNLVGTNKYAGLQAKMHGLLTTCLMEIGDEFMLGMEYIKNGAIPWIARVGCLIQINYR